MTISWILALMLALWTGILIGVNCQISDEDFSDIFDDEEELDVIA